MKLSVKEQCEIIFEDVWGKIENYPYNEKPDYTKYEDIIEAVQARGRDDKQFVFNFIKNLFCVLGIKYPDSIMVEREILYQLNFDVLKARPSELRDAYLRTLAMTKQFLQTRIDVEEVKYIIKKIGGDLLMEEMINEMTDNIVKKFDKKKDEK